MGTLTPTEVAREVARIRSNAWPLEPLLPMKNLYDRRVGTLVKIDGEIVSRVLLVNLFELRTRILDGSLEPENAQVEEYSSLEELVSHGWVGD